MKTKKVKTQYAFTFHDGGKGEWCGNMKVKHDSIVVFAVKVFDLGEKLKDHVYWSRDTPEGKDDYPSKLSALGLHIRQAYRDGKFLSFKGNPNLFERAASGTLTYRIRWQQDNAAASHSPLMSDGWCRHYGPSWDVGNVKSDELREYTQFVNSVEKFCEKKREADRTYPDAGYYAFTPKQAIQVFTDMGMVYVERYGKDSEQHPLYYTHCLYGPQRPPDVEQSQVEAKAEVAIEVET